MQKQWSINFLCFCSFLKTLETKSVLKCKCHGVSGSCDLKTCWKSAPNFRHVGDVIKKRFDVATRVQQRRAGSKLILVRTELERRHRLEDDLNQTPSTTANEEELVYLKESPDFCKPDSKFRHRGTQGRACNRTSQSSDACETLCCGRGYDITAINLKERCNCKFRYCCDVVCDVCIRDVKQYICHWQETYDYSWDRWWKTKQFRREFNKKNTMVVDCSFRSLSIMHTAILNFAWVILICSLIL